MEAFNVRNEIRAFSLKNKFEHSIGEHGWVPDKLYTWLLDFLYFHSHRIALYGILSCLLSVKAGVLRGSVLGPHPIPNLHQ